MAISIELWADRELVGGTETWWDDIELWLASTPDSERTYPLLSQVDPYGFITIGNEDLQALRAELERAALAPQPRVAEPASRLIELCLLGAELTSAELRFVGD